VAKHVPNKFLNLSLRFLNYPKFEEFIGDFDWLFLPNLNQFSVRATTKVALTVHDLSPVVLPECFSAKGRIWHWFIRIRRMLERANLIFAVSEYTKYDIVRLFGIDEKKIVVTHEGVNHRLLSPNIPDTFLREVRNIYNLPGDFILFLATVEPRKNLINLIEAFEQLDSPVHLVIAGKKGWKYERIFERIERSPKAKFVRYLGYVNEVHKPALMKLSRVFAFPSLYEGFGLPPLEAMAVGTPVVTSSVTSLPEVCGNSALLVNPHSVEEITRGLYHVLSDERLRGQMISEGFRQVRKFSWEDTARRVINSLKAG
jgi:glycosyltransferase involved in cell wall biosynthesis